MRPATCNSRRAWREGTAQPRPRAAATVGRDHNDAASEGERGCRVKKAKAVLTLPLLTELMLVSTDKDG
jgi:hypothetical protein